MDGFQDILNKFLNVVQTCTKLCTIMLLIMVEAYRFGHWVNIGDEWLWRLILKYNLPVVWELVEYWAVYAFKCSGRFIVMGRRFSFILITWQLAVYMNLGQVWAFCYWFLNLSVLQTSGQFFIKNKGIETTSQWTSGQWWGKSKVFWQPEDRVRTLFNNEGVRHGNRYGLQMDLGLVAFHKFCYM